MNVVVTGGTGFVGTNLIIRLLRKFNMIRNLLILKF